MPPTRPDLKVIHEVPVGAITPHPENARRGDVPAIARSLARLGQYRPLVVSWRTGHVCAGNHTLAAAASLGWDTIKVGYVTATPAQERAILLADNRLPELGHYDDPTLAALLDALTADDAALVAVTGYADAEAAALRGWTADEIAAAYDDDPAGFPVLNGGHAEYRCPSCRYEWDGSPRP